MNTEFGPVRYQRLRAAVQWALAFATLEIELPYKDMDTYVNASFIHRGNVYADSYCDVYLWV